jgi:membrane protease YdiL (CAAX protease family)
MTCLMMGSIFALEWSLGWLHVESFAWQTESIDTVILSVLLYAAICVLVGYKEELMSRGYHLQTIASGTSLAWAWIISSAVFGILHLANPHANLLSVTGIILAGLFLGYAYIRTGSLWLAIGLHTGWNFFEGVVFGFPVSGLPFYTLPRIVVSGPVLWTGGEFGPEAGMVLIPALVIGFVLIFMYAKDRSVTSVP